MTMPALHDLSAEWSALAAADARLDRCTLTDLFARDPARFETFSTEACGLLMDFSKEKIDAEAFAALIALAEAAGVEAARDAMFAGEKVNRTEARAALHMALRDGAGEAVELDGHDVMPEVLQTRARMLDFAEDVRAGRIVASDGRAFTDVIALGIGGSELGPAMACEALAEPGAAPRVHFVSNVDPAHLAAVTAALDPGTTLVVISSKSFTTLETMENARAAQAWLTAAGYRAEAHLAAVTTNADAAQAFDITPERMFAFGDWVGGRFSLWSSVGLPLALAIGTDRFLQLLAGGGEMDRHFRTAPLARNLPVLLALIGIWRRNVMKAEAVAVVPYAQRLARFPAFLQQLEMESNGKSVRSDGAAVARETAGVIFGEPGTGAQHSFFQLLHQGTSVVPVDFLLFAEGEDRARQRILLACGLAQAAALAFGDPDAAEPHRRFPGDRPLTTIVARRLDPRTLGALIALYEHKVAAQATIWGINPFDQFGVELGKRLAGDLLPALESGGAPGLDSSTSGLISAIRDKGA